MGDVESGRRWLRVVRFGLPGLALGWLAATWSGGAGPRPLAAQSNVGAAPGLIAVTGETPGNPNGSLLYLIDPRQQAFAIYRVDELKGTVKLEAARNFGYDLKVKEYNNQPPNVASVEAMVGESRVPAAPREP